MTRENTCLVTSYDTASGGNIVNQVQPAYNGLAQLITEYQSHSGAVNVNSTPKVQQACSKISGGANQRRLTSMNCPDGYVVGQQVNEASPIILWVEPRW